MNQEQEQAARDVVTNLNAKRLGQVDDDVIASRPERVHPVEEAQFDCDGNHMTGETTLWWEEVNGVWNLIVEVTGNIYVPGTDAVRVLIPSNDLNSAPSNTR